MINGFISSRVFYISSFLITNVCCIFIIEQKCKTHIWFGPWVGKIPGEGTGCPLQDSWASLVAQLLKNLPAMRETWVPSLGWEDPLENRKATHSSIMAWRIPWTIVHGVAKSRTQLSDFHFHFPCSCGILS